MINFDPKYQKTNTHLVENEENLDDMDAGHRRGDGIGTDTKTAV